MTWHTKRDQVHILTRGVCQKHWKRFPLIITSSAVLTTVLTIKLPGGITSMILNDLKHPK